MFVPEILINTNNKMETLVKTKTKLDEIKKRKSALLSSAVDICKKGTFSNTNGANKNTARNLIINYIKKGGTILTLPYKFATLEKMILNKISKKFKFIGYEYKKDVFYDLCSLIGAERLPISAIFGSISEAIYKAKENEFSNLILDYCGVLDTFAQEIEFAVKNNITEVRGCIAITLSKIGLQNSNGIIGEIFKTIPRDKFNSNLGETELGVMLFLNKILTSNYEVVEVFNYHDDKEDGTKGMAMILVIIRRNS